MQILKAAGMPLADITEFERLAALSEAELEVEAASRTQQIGLAATSHEAWLRGP